MSSTVRNLRFDGAGTLTFVEGRARRRVVSGEAFAVGSDELAETLLADPAVVDLDAPPEQPASDEVPEGTGYEAMTVPQLKELAAKRELEVPAKAKKDDLVALHVAADTGSEAAAADEGEARGPEAQPPDTERASTGGAITLGDLPASARTNETS